MSQVGVELASGSFVPVDVLIDGFMADVANALFAERAADLLWTPLIGAKFGFHGQQEFRRNGSSRPPGNSSNEKSVGNAKTAHPHMSVGQCLSHFNFQQTEPQLIYESPLTSQPLR